MCLSGVLSRCLPRLSASENAPQPDSSDERLLYFLGKFTRKFFAQDCVQLGHQGGGVKLKLHGTLGHYFACRRFRSRYPSAINPFSRKPATVPTTRNTQEAWLYPRRPMSLSGANSTRGDLVATESDSTAKAASASNGGGRLVPLIRE